MRKGLVLVGAALCLLLVARTAAAETNRRAEQIDQYQRMLTSLSSEDETHSAITELNLLRTQLAEARTLLAEGEGEALDLLLRRIKMEVQLIKALMKQGVAVRRAQTQEADAEALELEVGKLEREKRLLERRVGILELQARERDVQLPPTPKAGTEGGK